MATRFPSYLGSQPMGTTDRSVFQSGAVKLMLGEVKKVVAPTSQESQSKKYTEYVVEAQMRAPNGVFSTTTFPNCLLINPLAGASDRIQFTLDADPSRNNGEGLGNGAKVLVLCVDGDGSRAYIIGGIRQDTTSNTKDPQAKHFFFRFNGVVFLVEEDGSATLEFTGARKRNGDPKDDRQVEKGGGSGLILDKDGAVNLHTKDNDQYLWMDHDNSVIELKAAIGGVKIHADDLVRINAEEEMYLNSAHKYVLISAKEEIDMQSEVGVTVGAATDAWMKGTTYRNAESSMHTNMQSTLAQLQAQMATVAASLAAASAAMATPIVGAMMAAPAITTAGQAAAQATILFGQLSSAIAQFEGQSEAFLSKKNKTD